jgi:membrane-bound serine protease (ClpP class)
MSSAQLITAAAVLVSLLITGVSLIALLSRRKKARIGEPCLLGARGSVETTLKPEGSILIRGELWRARSRSGLPIERGQGIRVVGASGHLLEVEFAA